MIIGLSGAHGSGKTTLAKDYAEKYGIIYLDMQTGPTIVKLGYDPKNVDNYSFEERLTIQTALSEHYLDLLTKAKQSGCSYITDRTFLCLAGYMQTSFNKEKAYNQIMLENYVTEQIANCHLFKLLVILQPVLPYTGPAEYRPETSQEWKNRFHSTLVKNVFDERMTSYSYIMPRSYINQTTRLDCLHQRVKEIS